MGDGGGGGWFWDLYRLSDVQNMVGVTIVTTVVCHTSKGPSETRVISLPRNLLSTHSTVVGVLIVLSHSGRSFLIFVLLLTGLGRFLTDRHTVN